MSKLVKCPHCSSLTAEENLRCIYCGELLDISVGPLSFLSNTWGGLLIAAIALAIVVSFLVWLL
ncbi:hypothetical protein KDK77_01870 [bacterium]|nr:hypothetical protein [bacterium]